MSGAGKLAPGFAVAGVDSVVFAMLGKNVNAGASRQGFDRDQDPGVFGEKIASDEVDFVRSIRNANAVTAALGGEEVCALTKAAGGFDLHPREAMSRVDDEVVAFAVAIRLGDGESEAGGLPEESELGEFSAALGGALVGAAGRARALSGRGAGSRIVLAHKK